MQTKYIAANIQDGSGGWPKGTCLTCVNNYALCEHRARDKANDRHLEQVVRNARQAEIERICARYELESDEFMTREQKAAQYIR